MLIERSPIPARVQWQDGTVPAYSDRCSCLCLLQTPSTSRSCDVSALEVKLADRAFWVALIRRIARKNSIWGAPRIYSELPMLDFKVGEALFARGDHVERRIARHRLVVSRRDRRRVRDESNARAL